MVVNDQCAVVQNQLSTGQDTLAIAGLPKANLATGNKSIITPPVGYG